MWAPDKLSQTGADDNDDDDDDENNINNNFSVQSPHHLRGSLSAPSIVSTGSSSRSLATTFSTLEADDVAFFDEVVSTLGHGDTSFASLKTAYQEIRAFWPGINQQRDAHLWNSLLSLVKVRGRDWSERWDAVRVELGLDLRDPDVTESSLASVGTREGQGVTIEDYEGVATREERNQETSQSEGSNADHSSQSEDDEDDDVQDYWDQRRQSSANSSLTTLGAEAGASTSSSAPPPSATTPKSSRSRDEVAALQARMADLTRQAGALALQAGRQSAALSRRSRDRARQYTAAKPPSPSHRDVPGEVADAYQLRREQIIRLWTQRHSEGEESEGESSDPQNLVSRRHQREATLPARSPVQHALAAVTSSRGSVRDVVSRLTEENEESALRGTVRLAQRHYEEHLLANCLGWWCELSERESERQRKADGTRAHTLLFQTFVHWKDLALTGRQLEGTAERAERVRCHLSAWRKWRRRAEAVREQRWEGRKDEMREAYAVIKEKRQSREQSSFWKQWRSRLLEKRSSNFRNGHLLGGAFFLWRLKIDVAHTLGSQEKQVLADKKHSLKGKVFQKWRIDTRMMCLLDRWDDTHAENRLRRPMELWKKRAALSTMERAYSTHRLQRFGLQSWLIRLAECSARKRRQAQADRRLRQSTQKIALQQWKLTMQRVKNRNAQAAEYQKIADQKRSQFIFKRWRGVVRGHLYSRVRSGRLQKDKLSQWRAAFRRKTIELPHRAEAFSVERGRGVLVTCFSHWQALTRSCQESCAEATSVATVRLLRSVVTKWQRVRNAHAIREEKAIATGEWFALRRTFSSMKSKVRSTKLQIFHEQHSAGLTSRFLKQWRARATQQSIDRLNVAHVRSMTCLRIERQTLQYWTQRVIERRSLLLEVGEARSETIMLKALQQWRRASGRVHGLQRLGQSFWDVKSEELLRRNVLRWSFRYRKARNLRERADRFAAAREAQIQSQVFVNWYDSWREGSLHNRELEIVMRRQEDAKGRIFDVWIARTKSFPAIRYDHSRLKRLAFRKWQEGLPGAISRRQAVELDTKSLIRKAFKHWHQSGKAKRAAKAAARFGGATMARLRRHSSRSQSPFLIKHRRSSGNSYHRGSSPLVQGELGEIDQRSESGASSLRRARSEVIESSAQQVQDISRHMQRPRSEANYALGRRGSGQSAASTAYKEAPSAVFPLADMPSLERRAEISSRSLHPRYQLTAALPVDRDETKHVRIRSPTTTRSSAPSSQQPQDSRNRPLRDPGDDGVETDTFSLTSYEAPEDGRAMRGGGGGGGGGGRFDVERRRSRSVGRGPSSLPSLSVAPSEDDRAGEEVRTERAASPAVRHPHLPLGSQPRPSSPATTSPAPSSSFTRTLYSRKDKGHTGSISRGPALEGRNTPLPTGLHQSGSESGFLEDLRKRRRAMVTLTSTSTERRT